MSHLALFLKGHPHYEAIALLAMYHAASAFIGSLPMPDASSSKLYHFWFDFLNKFAANYFRASASEGPAGNQPPKP